MDHPPANLLATATNSATATVTAVDWASDLREQDQGQNQEQNQEDAGDSASGAAVIRTPPTAATGSRLRNDSMIRRDVEAGVVTDPWYISLFSAMNGDEPEEYESNEYTRVLASLMLSEEERSAIRGRLNERGLSSQPSVTPPYSTAAHHAPQPRSGLTVKTHFSEYSKGRGTKKSPRGSIAEGRKLSTGRLAAMGGVTFQARVSTTSQATTSTLEPEQDGLHDEGAAPNSLQNDEDAFQRYVDNTRAEGENVF